MLQGKYSPYPGDVIEARLEPGEFVVNRNAVQAIGKENLEAMNDDNPRYAQEGGPAIPKADEGIYEQNQLKLRRARDKVFSMVPVQMDTIAYKEAFGGPTAPDPDEEKSKSLLQRLKDKFKGSVDEEIKSAESVVEWERWAPNLPGTSINPIQMQEITVEADSPREIERKKAEALLHDERMRKFGAYGKMFKIKTPDWSKTISYNPPPPPPPLGDIRPISEQLRLNYLSGTPFNRADLTSPSAEGILTEGYNRREELAGDHQGRMLPQEIPTEQEKRWELRRRMIFDSKSQPHPNDMLTVEDMAGKESGTEAQQLGFILNNYRVKETGLTFDDFKMDHPVAYETLKKNYSRAFYDMEGEFEVMQIEEEEQARSDSEDKKLMAPVKGDIADRYAQLTEEDAEARWLREQEEEEIAEAERMVHMSKVANFGLFGWEYGSPRKAARRLIDNYAYNNSIEAGNEQEGLRKIEGMDLDARSREYMGEAMLSFNENDKITNNVRPDDLKERAQNLRHLYNTVAEEQGLYSEKNTSGITTFQVAEYNAMIDDAYNWAMQGYQTPANAEKARLAKEQTQKEIEMQQQARQNAIDGMEQPKEKLSKKLKDFAGSLLFGQTGGYVQAYQEGGSVSLNNSRRLFNIARRKYA